MKRKLFVMLALAVLIAAVWCGTAGAEYYTFTTEPSKQYTVYPDSNIVISWATNFVPVKVEIGYDLGSYQMAFGTTIWVSDYVTVKTIESGLSDSMTADLIYMEAHDIETWTVRAYYGGKDGEYKDTDFFSIKKAAATITTPDDIKLAPETSATICWTTNFVPIKVEVGYDSGKYETVFGKQMWIPDFHAVKTIETGLAKSMSATLDYADACAPHEQWVVKAYYYLYNDWIASVSSRFFTFDIDLRTITTTGSSFSVAPDSSVKISWTTNFTPTKIKVYNDNGSYQTVFGSQVWISDLKEVKTITTGLSAEMYTYLSYSQIDEYTSDRWVVQAIYDNSLLGKANSNPIFIELLPRTITTPANAEVAYGDKTSISWTTNFKPKKITLINDHGAYQTIMGSQMWFPEDHEVKNITSELSKEMTMLVSYADTIEQIGDKWRIRAYYGTGSYDFITSDYFKIDYAASQFCASPAGGAVYPWAELRLSWETNFVPDRAEIGYFSSGNWVKKGTVSANLQKIASWKLDFNTAVEASNWAVRAYYGEEYVTSSFFTVQKFSSCSCGDNLTATLDANGVLTLSGTGPMYDYSTLNLPPWFSVSTSIKKIVIPDGVTYIGRTAFYNCKNLTQVDMMASVTAIGNSAFLACTSLRSVSYNGFKSQWDAINIGDNSNLRNASISYLHRSGRLGTTNVYYELIGRDGSLWIDGYGGSAVHMTLPWADVAQYITELHVDVDTLWEDAFRDCTGVKKVYLSDSLTLVDDGAFNDCTRLTDIYYDSTAADWDSIEILDHNDPLLNAALHTAPHQEQLTVDLSWSVNDEGLLRIWLDDDLMGDGEHTAIPDYTSHTATPWYTDYKDMITSLRIESGVTSIGMNAFRALPHLRTISITDTVTSIGDIAFAQCTSLEDFTLPNSIQTIGSNTFMNCDYLELIHLPNSITFLGAGAFRDCGNLEKVWLPNQLTTILGNTFMDCPLLDHIDIPVSVTAINANAFLNCTELASSTGRVYYGGTSAQWKQISVNATGNTSLVNCPNIHMTPQELRIDENHFPDAEFRGYVSTNVDADQSGWLTNEEIANALVIQCGAINAESLAGMEYFTELEELNCADNVLTQLELSANTKLVSLECQDNAITSLSLEALPDLYYLNCAGNQLTALDVSHQTLEALYCKDNQLTELDVSGQALKVLDCQNNPLTLLNLSFQDQLDILNCYGTNLTALDLRGCPQLLGAVQYGTKTSTANYVQYQYIDNKQERISRLRVDADTELIIPGSVRIDAAHFPDDAFRDYVAVHFDTNGSGYLSEKETALAADINAYEYDTSGFESLEGIELFTQLSFFSLADCPNLTEIDLSANTKIGDIDIWDTGLTGLNVQGMRLGSCSIARSPLTSLTLGAQPDLYLLYCLDADLTSLDITGCPLLLDAIVNGARTEENGHVTYEGDAVELMVDADVQLITGLTMTVAFDFQNGSVPVTQEVPFVETAEAPAEPIRSRALFTGWYTDPGCAAETLYDFSAPVTVNITLYAGWLIPEPNGMLTLPAALTSIEDAAFSGIAAEAVLIPDTVTSISGNPFAGSGVRYIYGTPGSDVQAFAEAYEYTFVPVAD